MLSRRAIVKTVQSTLALSCIALFAVVAYAGFTQPAGVEIDAKGVLRTKIFHDPSGELTRARIAHAKSSLDRDVMKTSKLRKISLNRLEAELAKRLADGQVESNEMKYLAGITKITNVFYYPETKDIVIAGPAGGWYENIAGRAVSMKGESSVLQLQDLVAALRCFSPTGDKTAVIGCSIDPTQEGLKRMQDFLRNVGRNINGKDANAIATGLKNNLGLQTVTIKGVSPKTHFAQVMVEADYRMKMIGIGLERPQTKITSYIDKASPRDVSRNAMQRWYFVPNYDCITVSEDDLSMELVGNGVKLIGQDEYVSRDGSRMKTKNKNRASQVFTTQFTKKYNDLASKTAIYDDLRSMFDLAIVAAYIQHQDYYGMSGWDMELLGDEDKFSIENYEAPKQVETAVNAVWKGNLLMTPVGGGVNIQARQAVKATNMKYDEQGKIKTTHKAVAPTALKDGQWWWD